MKNNIVIIGATTLDIIAIGTEKIKMNDSNVGNVTISYGGVGRNIAENAARLSKDVKLISVVGNDEYGKSLIAHALNHNIDLSKTVVLDNSNTDSYVSIMDLNGSLVTSIAKIENIKHISVKYVKENRDFIDNAKLVVMDANLDNEVVKEILKTNCLTIFDAVSGSKIINHLDHLNKFDIVKLNEKEASIVFNKNIYSLDDIKANIDHIASFNIKKIVITMGGEGSAIIINKDITKIPAYPTKSVNTLGCGDAYMGAMVYALTKGDDLVKSCHYGAAAAAITTTVKSTTTNKVNINNIEKVLKEQKWT